jgi:chitinase
VPDAPVEHAWDTPWAFLGPVLPGDRPAPSTVPDSTYPEWSEDEVYVKGDLVSLGGVGFEAQWWTRGDRPDPDVDAPWDNPWLRVEVPDPDQRGDDEPHDDEEAGGPGADRPLR